LLAFLAMVVNNTKEFLYLIITNLRKKTMENVTDGTVNGVPKDVVCIAPAAYTPGSVIQKFCNDLERINQEITDRYPGIANDADNGPLGIEDINLKIKISPIIRSGTTIPTVVINANPNYNPDDPKDATHFIEGNPRIGLRIDCENPSSDDNKNSVDLLMKKLRDRVKEWESRRPVTARKDPRFNVTTTYTGSRDVDGTRKRVIVGMGPSLGVIVSRPYTRTEAPSLYEN
jgi:hypothetical protein